MSSRELLALRPRPTLRWDLDREVSRQVRLDEVKKGGSDQRGREILDVYWSTKEYVIFRHAQGISPHFSDDEELARRQRDSYAEIGSVLTAVNALRSGAVWGGESVDREIARAISQALDGNVENSKRILVAVRGRLRNLRTMRGRLEYQTGSLAMTLLALVGFLVLAPPLLSTQGGSSFSPLMLAQVAACGALGGFLSVAIGIRRVEIDPDTYWVVNGLAGAFRIVIAVIGSIFVYFAIVSELILGNLSFGASTAGIFAISIAAGFSETFVPNMLQQVAQGSTPQK